MLLLIMNARIHSWETMGSVDGPGMRYVLFFQGCNMKCQYCHNRDTWSPSGGRIVDLDTITGDIESLSGFYKHEDGGVTASGGEPLLQSEFISNLFDSVHNMGLTTAVDTSGHVQLNDMVKSVLGKTDYLLLDIKSFNEEVHRKLTGVDQKLVFEFIDYLKQIKINIWLRYVFIPGYTDSNDDCRNLIEFINLNKNIKRVDILPYHHFGREKWLKMGYKYPFENQRLPQHDEIEFFKSRLKESTGVIVK